MLVHDRRRRPFRKKRHNETWHVRSKHELPVSIPNSIDGKGPFNRKGAYAGSFSSACLSQVASLKGKRLARDSMSPKVEMSSAVNWVTIYPEKRDLGMKRNCLRGEAVKYSVILQFNDSYSEELGCREIEINITKAIKPYLDREEFSLDHLEVSAGSLYDAFGIGQPQPKEEGHDT